MADIEIEIDGQKLMAKPNQTVIQVADEAGIYIPRFCYHKHLTIPANCRMCLVEIEKAPKALPACATPVAPNMKVFTKSQKTIAAQRAVMEFLLINHPLDCPICDQGGECELQDLSMGYGSGYSHYEEPKRSVADQDLGPLISTEMTRCIYCTRCVRFGEEVAGLRELGAIGRGEFTEISTYIQHAIKSEISGNIIDLCPVGALTNKPYRFTARPWELDQAPSVSPHDCVGANINVHTRYGKVLRVVARENMKVNRTWIADRDRYSFTGLYHNDRLEHPRVRIDGELQVIDWQHAILHAASGLTEAIARHGADKFGALASPNSTLEEFYLLQNLVRLLDSPHIDHRLREMDTSDQAEMPFAPTFNLSVTDIAECDGIVLLGSNIQQEQPLIGVEVRKAALNGAHIVAINPVDYQFNFKVTQKKILAPQHLLSYLSSEMDEVIASLKDKQNVCVMVGAHALHHPESAAIRYFAQQMAIKLHGKLCLLTDGGNSAGGWIAGAVPHRRAGGEALNHIGLNAYEMLEKPRKAYLLLNVEPEFDCANAAHAIKAMQDADFVIALSTYRNPVLDTYADVILPVTPFTETSGTFVNAAGVWQTVKGVATPFESSRPAWKVLSALAKFLLLDGFDFESSGAVKKEVEVAIAMHSEVHADKPHFSEPARIKPGSESKLSRIGDIPLYAVDNIVRRAEPLQAVERYLVGNTHEMRIHPETAESLNLRDGEAVLVKQRQGEAVPLKVSINKRIAKGAAWVAGGVKASRHLGDLNGEIEILRAKEGELNS